jgi:hypothetical protein
MPVHTSTVQPHLAVQTVRGWPSLLLLGLSCALFVSVVVAVITPLAEPPAAVPVPAEAAASLPEPLLGGA